MEDSEWDLEMLYSWAKKDGKQVTELQEDTYAARIRVLVIDYKKSNSDARRRAYLEII